AVDDFRPGPALRCAQDDHRPGGAFSETAAATRLVLYRPDLGEHRIERAGHLLVHRRRIVAGDEHWLVAVTDEELAQFVFRNARQNGGTGDLVAIQMQYRQHRAIARRI